MAKKNAAKRVAAKQTIQTESTSAATMARVLAPQKSTLLGLPEEVKQKIYKLAVKEDDAITPRQMCDKSNKFIWSEKQLVKTIVHDFYPTTTKVVSAVPQLTALALAQTCHQIYDEVSLTNLFYQVNDFDFESSSSEDALAYLVAITEPRRNNIRSVRLVWGHRKSTEVFTMIASCKNIETLELVLTDYFYYRLSYTNDIETNSGAKHSYKQLLMAVQGVKNIKLILPSDDDDTRVYRNVGSHARERQQQIAASIAAKLETQSKLERNTIVNLDKLRKAQLAASLDVYGEGRLGDDKKPGVIASRTRQGIKNTEKLNAHGIIPEREKPKYALDGELTWWVTKIKGAREVLDDDGSVSSVEFLVISHPGAYLYNNPSGVEEESWEDLSVLGNHHSLNQILEFYTENMNACGKQVVLDVWKLLGDFESEDGLRNLSTGMIKRLQAIITKEAKEIAQKAEDEAKAMAKKAQAKAKKAVKAAFKTKKVKKPKKGGQSA